MHAFRRHRRNSAFTLIELMVAVAIIGILAATAITGYQLFQLRSKRSEALSNLASVRTVQLSYFNEAGSFLDAAPSPGLAGFPGPTKQVWQGTPFSSTPGTGFDALGWQPEGAVYFDYAAETDEPVGQRLTAAAYGDTDGDGTLSVFLYIVADNGGAVEPDPVLGLTQVWDPGTCTPLLNTVAQVHWTAACGFPTADDY